MLSMVLPPISACTAGVVADHAADGAAAVRGRVGGKGEIEFLCSVADAVEDDAGLRCKGGAVCRLRPCRSCTSRSQG